MMNKYNESVASKLPSNQEASLNLTRSVALDPMKPWRERVHESCFLDMSCQLHLPKTSRSLYFCFRKAPPKNLLDISNGNRLWAIDCCLNNAAKCFVWSNDLYSFLNVYLEIPELYRHAYEIIPPSIPCRMVYDLDMCLKNGVNSGRNHSAMMQLIGEFLVVCLFFVAFIY